MNPYWQTADEETVKLYHGDVLDSLSRLPTKSVHCVVTSPPYWGLRDYKSDKSLEIGCERSPEEFLAKMVDVFRAVKKVLRDDGTCWINLGDSYATTTLGTLKTKNLVGIPWRVALALQADGWYLRAAITWAKLSPMPDSVKDRPTKATEMIFLLTKMPKYFYDQDAERVPNTEGTISRLNSGPIQPIGDGPKQKALGNNHCGPPRSEANGRNLWDWWEVPDDVPADQLWKISGSHYKGAHFAVFPPEIPRRVISLGTSERGCCSKCGSPYKRVVERIGGLSVDKGTKRDRSFKWSRNGLDSTLDGEVATFKTIGWEATCSCVLKRGEKETVPCTVLDPFIGSGTTADVCLKLGRRCIGIDLSEEYLKKCTIPRIEGVLLSKPSLHHLIPQRERKPLNVGSKMKKTP